MINLVEKLREHDLIDSQENIILEKYEDGGTQSVDQATFTIFFGDKTFIYANLIGSHTFVWNEEPCTRTAEGLGYKKYFDEWKELGIIS